MLGLTSALASVSEKEQRYALSFDGTNDFVGLGVSNAIITASQDPVSFSCWLKTTNATGGYLFSCQRTNGSSAFSVNVQANGKPRGIIWNGGSAHNFPAATTSVDDGEWHHVAVVAKNNSQKIYVDGSLEAETTGAMDLPTSTDGCAIGAHSAGGGNFFNGSITNLAIFTVELSASAVTSIYNAGRHHNLNTPIDNYSSTPSRYYVLGHGLFDDKIEGIIHDQADPSFQDISTPMTNTSWSLNPVHGSGNPTNTSSNGWAFGVFPTTNTLSGTTASWDSSTRVVTINHELGGDNSETQLYQAVSVEANKVYRFQVECKTTTANQFRLHGNIEGTFNGGNLHSGSGGFETVSMVKRASTTASRIVRCQRAGSTSGSGIVTGQFKNFSATELKGKPGLVSGATFVSDN
jgi:hypothetical protein